MDYSETQLPNEEVTNNIEVKFPRFHDTGEFSVIDGESVETGKYFVDTCEANGMWETYVKFDPIEDEPDNLTMMERLKKDVEKYNDEDDNFEHVQEHFDLGVQYGLWRVKNDPKGEGAEKFHNKILELVKRNLSYEELNNQIQNAIDKINDDFVNP